ncbi:SNF2 family N-terminal domain-containing protein [Aspergillus granulosus]|uniref:SNF2 family N-terminal domain-containing protein n=1 Tax=Aspergillus granulosus TaxID=176169 RepID=A0ABR4HPB7_9EURO
MARESNAPTDPATPGKPREQAGRPLPQHPEFGKPSPLRPSYPQKHGSSNPFNIPKQNRPRVEHHRPHHHQQQQQQQQQQARPQNPLLQNATRPNIPPLVASTPKRSEPFDPFKPVRPSAYNNSRMSRPVDNDVVEIRRPENITFNTPRAPKMFYASKPSPMKANNGAKNLQNFVDLTTPSGGDFSTSRLPRGPGFGSAAASEWVDTAKANENIKALLEGAFEDEEEKLPKPKGKKKKNKKNNSKRKDVQSQPQAKEEGLDIDDLAAQLQGVTVNESQPDSDESNESPSQKTLDIEAEEDEDIEEEKEISDEGSESEEEEDEDDDGTVEGLNVKLLPHQRQGVKWMFEKEIGSRRLKGETKGILPKGGILADDMGLGKTVQAIALMLTNQKPKDGSRRRPAMFEYDEDSDDDNNERESQKLPPGLSKSTLVVAPLALIKQWESEIKTKVEAPKKLRVLVYHGNARAKSTDSLEDYDVVITTYGTLTSEHNAVSKNDKKTGVFSVYWYRIILDEAHTIKNRNAKATQASYALDAEYRWCLSGTPMQNNLDELQSLIRFLRIKPYNDLANWKDQITRPLANGRGGLAIERLQVVLKAFMKRRTKDVLKLNAQPKSGKDEGDGDKKKGPGFHIVKREVIKVAVEFMPGERNFYRRLEQRTENSLEKMMGDSKMDYAGALVLLLRLRQSCNHPDLVKSDLAKDKDVLLQTGNANSQSSTAKKDDLDAMADLFGALSVVTKKCDICQMELSKEESTGGGSRCSECEKDFNTPFTAEKKKKASQKVIDLTASPLERRSEDRMARSRKNRRVVMDSDDEEEEDGEWIVPESQRAGLSLGKAGGSDDEDAEGGGDWIGSEDSETDDEPESPSRRIVRKNLVDEDSEDDIYLNPGDAEDQELPSTKIRHLMKILRREAPDFKFIVFSVFTSMLDKVEPFLKRSGIGYARYDGSMRNDLREASLEKLRNNRATRVLLCSLRAGALGLNLTAASRVVILEPFWNPFVEEQAIDRVHRLNQTVDVKIYKMIIKDSVEERILDLQDRKRELANVTIEGKTAAAKLTMKDMMALFGKDAELRYKDDQTRLDYSPQKGNLLTSSYESASQGRLGSESDASRDRNRKPERRAPPSTEDSVYGRRW